ncbi:acyl-CoA dehydrogenase family protein [Nocardioides sp. Soil796]|uniref:acyl-CoA dehydrogenase family protein n=1 Tax=Nocardioides sp. Soil796 TaxID=1736412 RepID=UPI00070EAAEA|nr:acyl-CoA dehydrogenase family protein [Nocardioides sp. Soil796]KRF10408.1 acyl-CoA dehydrogenase [Nocardioides sp. Soil796]
MIAPEIHDLDFDGYRKLIAEFTQDELIPAENEMVAAGAVPERLIQRMGELGLFGITIPREYGGLGWSMEQQVLLTFEFTRASCVYRSRFSTVIGLCSQGILDHATDEQRQELLPRMAAGELVTAFALTEEGAGSDAANLTTTAERRGDVYVLNGSKRYITNAAWADAFVVFARTDPNQPGANGVSAFIVDAATPGVTTALPEIMNGHAEAPVGEIHFEDVEVPAANLLGGVEGTGLTMALRGINHARMHVAATCVGQATRILEETTAHVNGREQFGSALSELGAVQATLGESFAEMEAGRALVIESARSFDTGVIPRHRIAAAKLYGSEMASRVADRCVQLLGGEGIVGPHPVPRMWRDVRALRIYEGSSPIHERNLGRAMVKQVSADGTLPNTFRA